MNALKVFFHPQYLFVLLWLTAGVASRIVMVKRDRRLHEQFMRELIYYVRLDKRQQARFRDRVRAVVADKEFIGRGIEVTPEMRHLLAASVVQVTFGLSIYNLTHFSRIIVYPDRYRSRISKEDHVGEVNPGMRAIVVSWKRFYEDYRIVDDARNLGLHEMAHAVWFEHKAADQEYVRLDPRLMQRWRELAQAEASRIVAGKGGLFRKYASTNQEEFFAVAVEYFFEQPHEFKSSLPELYSTMVGLLKQDPADYPD